MQAVLLQAVWHARKACMSMCMHEVFSCKFVHSVAHGSRQQAKAAGGGPPRAPHPRRPHPASAAATKQGPPLASSARSPCVQRSRPAACTARHPCTSAEVHVAACCNVRGGTLPTMQEVKGLWPAQRVLHGIHTWRPCKGVAWKNSCMLWTLKHMPSTAVVQHDGSRTWVRYREGCSQHSKTPCAKGHESPRLHEPFCGCVGEQTEVLSLHDVMQHRRDRQRRKLLGHAWHATFKHSQIMFLTLRYSGQAAEERQGSNRCKFELIIVATTLCDEAACGKHSSSGSSSDVTMHASHKHVNVCMALTSARISVSARVSAFGLLPCKGRMQTIRNQPLPA